MKGREKRKRKKIPYKEGILKDIGAHGGYSGIQSYIGGVGI
jgi:hypothetical protein